VELGDVVDDDDESEVDDESEDDDESEEDVEVGDFTLDLSAPARLSVR
jgi:hypothetical protein